MDRQAKLRLLFPAVADVFMILAVGIPLGVVYNTLKPVRRGFFCDDTSIRYPYHSNTVSFSQLAGFGIAIPTGTVLILELLITLRARSTNKWKSCLLRVLRGFGFFIFGGISSFALSEVGKLTIGGLRPNFIDVCRPNFTLIDCSKGYITDYECTGPSLRRILDGRKSFPSGHAVFSCFGAVFVVLLLEFRLYVPQRLSRFLKIYIQMIVIGLALYCSFSRVTDNKHHWCDVIVGCLLGVVVGLWIFLRMAHSFGIPLTFRRKEQQTTDNTTNHIYLDDNQTNGVTAVRDQAVNEMLTP